MMGCREKCILKQSCERPKPKFSSLLSQTHPLGPIMDIVKGSAERKVKKMKIVYVIEEEKN